MKLRIVSRMMLAIGAFGGVSAALLLSDKLTEILDEVYIDRMKSSSVSISVSLPVKKDFYNDDVWQPGSGSGFVLSKKDCLIGTAAHVVDGAQVVKVSPHGWMRKRGGIEAEVVYFSLYSEVAVLHVDDCGFFSGVRIGDPRSVKQGDRVMAIGNPQGYNPDSVTVGFVSHLQRSLPGVNTPMLQIDNILHPGNSGGGLFNRFGELIAVNIMIGNEKSGPSGISYAIPIDYFLATVERLKNGQRVGHLGLKGSLAYLSPKESEHLSVPNGKASLLVIQDARGPSAGKILRRDLIYKIGGRSIENISARSKERELVLDKLEGEGMTFDLVRLKDGRRKKMAVTVVLEGIEEKQRTNEVSFDGSLGLKLKMWTDREFAQFRPHPVITGIVGGGIAHRAGLKSSQHLLIPIISTEKPVLIAAYTITGAICRDSQVEIRSIAGLEGIAKSCFSTDGTLLLIVERWLRRIETPDDEEADGPYIHAGASLFRLRK